MSSSAYIDNSSLIVGRGYSSGWNFNGTIDDVRIYNRVLSGVEIGELYHDGLSSKAYNPSPADGAKNLDRNIVLGWSAGKDALSHDVYFGTDSSSLESKGNQSATDYDCGFLDYGTTYFWRIDEKNSDSTTTEGDVWSFTTASDGSLVGLVGHWKFDETSDNTAHDSSGYGNGGTVYGDAVWTGGQIDGALSFDGDSDYVVVPDNDDSLDMTGDMTIAVWMKVNDINHYYIKEQRAVRI
jgi:hypothetical protein